MLIFFGRFAFKFNILKMAKLVHKKPAFVVNKLLAKGLDVVQLQNSSRYLSGGFEILRLLRLPCRKGGRPRLMDENKIKQAKSLLNEKKFSVIEICRSLGVSRGTLYRSLELRS